MRRSWTDQLRDQSNTLLRLISAIGKKITELLGRESNRLNRSELGMKSHMRPIKEAYVGRNRVKYEAEIVHEGLGLSHWIKAFDEQLLLERAETKMNQLDKKWEKLLKEQRQKAKLDLAETRTQKAQEEQRKIELILGKCNLSTASPKFKMLLRSIQFTRRKPVKQYCPPEPEYRDWPAEPQPSQFKTKTGCGCLTFLLSTKKNDAVNYQTAHNKWKQELANVKKENNIKKDFYKEKWSEIERKYLLESEEWKTEKDLFDSDVATFNNSVRKLSDGYRKGQKKDIGDLFKLILNHCELPSWVHQSHRTLFNPENGILAVEALLPSQKEMPTLESVRYVKTRDEFVEKHIAILKQNTLYDTVLYKVVLRSIFEVFRWDIDKHVKAVVYNGSVSGVEQATGKKINPCILSIQALRDEFENLNLKSVDPKACFKKLKGVSSSKLFTLIPVAPVLRIDKGDRRFVEGRQVVDGLSEGDNLAAMNWEDFEHLIRELFEKEFAESGGEVKVTQASRDGGVDAIIFDPDPIRGGKIVVQAKRYTNTVGVSAVRDLYGTLMNEGANKGILVSTSDYGPDAYKFAKGKPLVLLNGGELLYLLEKHGHKSRIDIKEAKMLFAEQEKMDKKGRSQTKSSGQ